MQEQIYPAFAPIPGQFDVCGIDAAHIFRGLRGVQNLVVTDGKVDYGCGVIDGGILQYLAERHGVLEATIVSQQDEVDINRQFSRQGEFYAFGENPTTPGGLLSGGKKVKPLILTLYRADEGGYVKTVGAGPIGDGEDWQAVQKGIQEAVQVYLRVEWQ